MSYRILSKDELEERKKAYPVGCRIKLLFMDDPYATCPVEGSIGTVTRVDPLGDLEVNWDCGSTLKVIYGVDSFVRL